MATSATLSPNVHPNELAQALSDGTEARIVDVRTPAEFESAHIPGSYNVPLDQLGEYCGELAECGAPLVLVCRSGTRARQAESMLRKADVSRLHVLDGGLSAWESAGQQVILGRPRWGIERQVRAIAGALVLLGTLGSLFIWQPLIFLAVFVGAGLLFAGLTDICGMALVLGRLPYNRGATCDVSRVVAELKASRA